MIEIRGGTEEGVSCSRDNVVEVSAMCFQGVGINALEEIGIEFNEKGGGVTEVTLPPGVLLSSGQGLNDWTAFIEGQEYSIKVLLNEISKRILFQKLREVA